MLLAPHTSSSSANNSNEVDVFHEEVVDYLSYLDSSSIMQSNNSTSSEHDALNVTQVNPETSTNDHGNETGNNNNDNDAWPSISRNEAEDSHDTRHSHDDSTLRKRKRSHDFPPTSSSSTGGETSLNTGDHQHQSIRNIKNSATSSSSTAAATSSMPASSNNIQEHREFVHAIFTLGLKESSPLSVMDHMSERSKAVYEGLNLERIKSKLQKFRKKKDRNTAEFMDLYESTLEDFCELIPKSNSNRPKKIDRRLLPPIETLGSGEIAAYLSFSVLANEHLNDDDNDDSQTSEFSAANSRSSRSRKQQRSSLFANMNKRSRTESSSTAQDATIEDLVAATSGCGGQSGNKLIMPTLTEAEKKAPIGKAFASFMTLYKSMEEQLDLQRKKNRPPRTNDDDGDHFTFHLREEMQAIRNPSRQNQNPSINDQFQSLTASPAGLLHGTSSLLNGASSIESQFQQLGGDSNNMNALLTLLARQNQNQQQQQQQQEQSNLQSLLTSSQYNTNFGNQASIAAARLAVTNAAAAHQLMSGFQTSTFQQQQRHQQCHTQDQTTTNLQLLSDVLRQRRDAGVDNAMSNLLSMRQNSDHGSMFASPPPPAPQQQTQQTLPHNITSIYEHLFPQTSYQFLNEDQDDQQESRGQQGK